VSYASEVGERLRRIRVERGWSLQDVERESEGRWKAAVVGSYERGDRNISATRLLELAEFYGVRPSEVLPGDPPPRRDGQAPAVVLDLSRLELLDDRFRALRRYLEVIQLQRGDYNRKILSVRGEDLRSMAIVHDSTVEELIADLERHGVLYAP
jgi:transcriptional regulator with XRE-family HTH domain